MSFGINRRHFIAAGSAASVLPAFGDLARAQAAYPNKPIKIVVGYPAGGQTDIIGRAYGDYLARTVGQPVIVDNKGGAGGILGAVEVKRAPADGYTLMCTISTTMVQNRVTVKNLPYDADNDFALIASVTQVGFRPWWKPKTTAPPIEGVHRIRQEDRQGQHRNLCGGLDCPHDRRRTQQAIWAEHRARTLSWRSADVGRRRRTVTRWRDRKLQCGAGGASNRPRKGDRRNRHAASQRASGCSAASRTGCEIRRLRSARLYMLCRASRNAGGIIKKLSDTMLAGGKDPKVQETLATFNLNPPIGHEEATKLFREQTPLWVKFMADVGLKAE